MISLRVALAAAVLLACAGIAEASDRFVLAQYDAVGAPPAEGDRTAPPQREPKAKERTPPPRPIVRPAGQQLNPALREECAWVGQRIVSLLFRDDPMTGNDFFPFYTRFGCPEAHLTQAFGCVVRGGSLENDGLADRIAVCWTDPLQRPPADAAASDGTGRASDRKPADAKPAEPRPANAKPAEGSAK
jgi:hypothetical protein